MGAEYVRKSENRGRNSLKSAVTRRSCPSHMNHLSVLILSFGSSMVCAAEPFVVAHRGASAEAPENTIPAFELAWKQGADAIEGDFHLTKDGQIVCIHDRDTGKVADRKLLVSESTLAELQTLDVGAHKDARFKGTKIPTIAEVFATVPEGRMIFIEIKCGGEIVNPLIDEIGKSGLQQEQIVVISFNANVLKELKMKAPEYKVSWLCNFKGNGKDRPVSPSIETTLDTLGDIETRAISSGISIPDEYLATLMAQGYEWHVWTVNDRETARRAKARGAASITTDVPGRLRTYLRE